jgi:hypothetical protein
MGVTAVPVAKTIAQGPTVYVDLGVRTWDDAGTTWDDSEVTWGGWTARGGHVVNKTEGKTP